MQSNKFFEKVSSNHRVQRSFSDDFKRKKVLELDKKLISVSELCKEYEVTRASVYRWIYKYSSMRKKSIRTIVEAKSDTRKIKLLKQQVQDLQGVVGQKQLLVEFQQKVIELAEKHYQIDIKKKFGSSPFNGSGNID
ncbi:MAG: transposase [Flavitalea sp.]